jgi:type II secretion system protein H
MKKKKEYFLSLTGFTLIELLIVIAIALIIAGAVVPHLDTSLTNKRLEIDAKKLASNISLAQQYAMGQKDGSRSYGIIFYEKGYRLIPYDSKGDPLSPVIVPSCVNANGDIPFSKGITLGDKENIIFNFKGSITNEVNVVLDAGDVSKTITVAKLTGTVSIK